MIAFEAKGLWHLARIDWPVGTTYCGDIPWNVKFDDPADIEPKSYSMEEILGSNRPLCPVCLIKVQE